MNQKLINFFKKQICRIEAIMTQDNRSFNIDKYHELRVELKKIKLIINIIDESGVRFQNKKHVNQLMRMFKQAGKIRELDLLKVHLKSFKAIKKTSALKLKINNTFKKEKQIFFKMKSIPIDYKKLKKVVSKKIKKIASIENYLKSLKRNIKQDFKNWKKLNLNQRNKKSISVSKLHEARIHLKYWINYLKIFNQHIPDNQFVALEGLALKLGEWHDLIEFKKYLNHWIENEFDKKDSIDDVLLVILKDQQQIEFLEMDINKKIKEIDWVDD